MIIKLKNNITEKLKNFELTDEAKERLQAINQEYITLAIEALGGEV